jgi:acetolactate synthase-1/2/3 large subunit
VNELTAQDGTATVSIAAKKTGAWLARYALEQLPITHTFGIPGVHNTELYDELNSSPKICPVLVTHEGGAAFIADAISRTTQGEIGTLVIVPAAGLTHAMSGIGEAFLDGIPMLIISGGTRKNSAYGYQVHEIDQAKLAQGVTKAVWCVTSHEEIVPTIFKAYHLAVSGTPGPVLVEIPVDLQLFQKWVEQVPAFTPHRLPAFEDDALIDAAVALLAQARHPGIFVGWGALDVAGEVERIASWIGAPVVTTLQGLSAFSAAHPLHAGMGFGLAAVPAAAHAFKDCDCLLAIGTRFSEVATGSYGCEVPPNLIHIDINPEVINRNYPAKIGIVGDARVAVPLLRQKLEQAAPGCPARRETVALQIAKDKQEYLDSWLAHSTDRVNPAKFFVELRRQLASDAIAVVDDGNHTYLAAELFPVYHPRSFVSPTDFNCMGYCVPGAIGAKLVNPDKQVVGIVGDGGFIMTGMEILTATAQGAGVAFFVFYDGELSQISQGQQIPYNRKTCTVMGEIKFEGMALATGAKYVVIEHDGQIAGGIKEALETAGRGQPVIVDVRIDYTKRTRFTQGVVKAMLNRFPLGEKFRFIGRAFVRKVTG